jgi:hypothetical protein
MATALDNGQRLQRKPLGAIVEPLLGRPQR